MTKFNTGDNARTFSLHRVLTTAITFDATELPSPKRLAKELWVELPNDSEVRVVEARKNIHNEIWYLCMHFQPQIFVSPLWICEHNLIG